MVCRACGLGGSHCQTFHNHYLGRNEMLGIGGVGPVMLGNGIRARQEEAPKERGCAGDLVLQRNSLEKAALAQVAAEAVVAHIDVVHPRVVGVRVEDRSVRPP